MLVGLPGSGKSTYAKKLMDKENLNFVVHSSDSIRKELSGDESNQDINKLVFETLHNRVVEDLENRRNVIYDATNISSKRRRAFVNTYLNKVDCFKRCTIIATPYEICYLQNLKRDRVVPNRVLVDMYKKFETPYYNEGWDEINIHYEKEEYKSIYGHFSNFPADTITFDQMNSHHTATLGKHCLLCKEYVFENQYRIPFCYREVEIAATIHDCGKPFTQAFRNAKGEPTKDAHYYGHNSVGAYNSLFYDMEKEVDRLYVSALICWHMLMHFFKNWKDKTKKKYEDMFLQCDKDFWHNLKILNEGDVYGH